MAEGTHLRQPRRSLGLPSPAAGVGLAFVAVTSVLPLGALVAQVLAAMASPQQALQTLLEADVLQAATNSLTLAALGAALATAYGLTVALWITLTHGRWRGWLVLAFTVQTLLPPQVVAMAWTQLWLQMRAPLGSLGLWPADLGNPLQSLPAMALLLGLHYAPLVFLTTRAALLTVHPHMLEAAWVAGVRTPALLRHLLLPLIAPALAAGTGLAFVSCLGNFGIPALLGIPANLPTLPTLIYRELTGFGPQALPRALLLTVWILALAGLGFALQHWGGRGTAHQVIAAHQALPPLAAGRWQRRADAVLLALVTVWLVLPLAALLAAALRPALGVALTWDNATWAHFAAGVWDNPATLQALRNSLVLAATSAAVLAAVALLVGHQAVVLRRRWAQGVLPLADWSYAIPGMVLAVGLLLLYLKPLPLLGVTPFNTVWILLLAYLARFLALALRPVLGSLTQLPSVQWEAAAVCGATPWHSLTRVVLPLAAPAVAAGGALVMLLALNELTVSALLWSGGAQTLGVATFALEQAGDSAAAAALGVTATALTVVLMLLASLLGRRLPKGVLPWQA